MSGRSSLAQQLLPREDAWRRRAIGRSRGVGQIANINDGVVPDPAGERSLDLLRLDDARIERIVSTGQATPAGEWLAQAAGEWVILLEGKASLRFLDQETTVHLRPGDYLWIAPNRQHRVEWTDPDAVTVWLAVHLGGA